MKSRNTLVSYGQEKGPACFGELCAGAQEKSGKKIARRCLSLRAKAGYLAARRAASQRIRDATLCEHVGRIDEGDRATVRGPITRAVDQQRQLGAAENHHVDAARRELVDCHVQVIDACSARVAGLHAALPVDRAHHAFLHRQVRQYLA